MSVITLLLAKNRNVNTSTSKDSEERIKQKFVRRRLSELTAAPQVHFVP
jgi:hypothetical protein